MLKENAYIVGKARYIDLSITRWSSGSRIAKADDAMTLQMALFYSKTYPRPFFSWVCQIGQKRTRIITHRCSLIIFRRFVNVFSNYVTANYVTLSTIKQLRGNISPYAAQVTITTKPETTDSVTPA